MLIFIPPPLFLWSYQVESSSETKHVPGILVESFSQDKIDEKSIPKSLIHPGEPCMHNVVGKWSLLAPDHQKPFWKHQKQKVSGLLVLCWFVCLKACPSQEFWILLVGRRGLHQKTLQNFIHYNKSKIQNKSCTDFILFLTPGGLQHKVRTHWYRSLTHFHGGDVFWYNLTGTVLTNVPFNGLQ